MEPPAISRRRWQEVIDALRRGTVPVNGLDVLAVGLDRFQLAVDEGLDRVAFGGAVFKAVRGEYGAGKTFLARWLEERARRRGMATAEVQVSERETPLHRLETVYRRLIENLSTAEFPPSALRPILDAWLFALEEDVLRSGRAPEADPGALGAAVDDLLERRLAEVSRTTPPFAAALRGYRRALAAGEAEVAEGLAAWLGGQPHVAAAIRRQAGLRGDLDHFGALGFLQGLLAVLRDSGHRGLVVVLDEVDTLQRMRSDARERALNAMRQLIDEVDAGRYPASTSWSPAPRPSSTVPRASSACLLWPSAWPPISRPRRASTTRGPCRFGCRASPSSGSQSWGGRCATSSPRTARRAWRWPTTPTSPTLPKRSRDGSAVAPGWRRASS